MHVTERGVEGTISAHCSMKRGQEDHFGNVAVRWRIVIGVILRECGARMLTEFMCLWMGFSDRVVNTEMIYRFP
jgi:hypothetical protein